MSDPDGRLVPATHPDDLPAADASVRVAGDPVFVRETPPAAVAGFDVEGTVTVEVEAPSAFDRLAIRPLSRAVRPTVEGRTVRFDLDPPARLSLEFDGPADPLFLFADRPDSDPPDPDDPSVRYLEGGTVHGLGGVTLEEGETLYLERGAVLRGVVGAVDAPDVSIRGRGAVDPAGVADDPATASSPAIRERAHVVQFVRCPDAVIEGVTLYNLADAEGWTLAPVECDGATVRNAKVVGQSANDDGIDVVGSRGVRIEDCFVRTRDDCVAVKATDVATPTDAGCRDVRDLRVRGSTFWNGQWGNAIEIGYETRADEITDVAVEDCDVIRAEREGGTSGGVLTIHDGDRARVHDVRYDDVRVEDARQKLLDFKVQYSGYSVDEERGRIEDVLVRDLRVVDGALPPSVIQGYDGDHPVAGVTIENLQYRGRRLTSELEARLVSERTRDVRFVTSGRGPTGGASDRRGD